MNFSIYGTIYLAAENNLDYQFFIDSAMKFLNTTPAGGELVIVCNNEGNKDGTVKLLKNYKKEKSLKNLKIYLCDIPFSDYAFDGKMKEFALRKCENEIVIGLDADEIIPPTTKTRWVEYANKLINSNFKAFPAASVDLCRDEQHFKSINAKPSYLHKKTGVHRGIVNFAKLSNGKMDTEKSDSTEVLDENGDLAAAAWPNQPYTESMVENFGIPYVLHYWGVDLEKRKKTNIFWKPVWEARAGHDVDIVTNLRVLENIPVFRHNLSLK